MKIQIIRTIILSVILTMSISCVEDKTFDNKSTILTTELDVTKTVSAINTLTTGTPTLYTADDVIEAYVTSNDETGNFFTSISLQTLAPTGTNPIGFSVSADFKSFGWGFTPGRKIYIKLKGLYTARIDGSMKIGSLFNNNGTLTVGRIANFDWDKHLFPSQTIVSESDLVQTRTISNLENVSNLNILTEIENVQFADSALGRTLFDETLNALGLATNHIIIEVGTNKKSTFRTSQFASMARSIVPPGKGKIRGVLTRFGSGYQFFIRTLDDLKLTNPRINFLSTLNDDFTSYTETSQIILPKYINFYTEGTKNWRVRNDDGDPNKYLEMSAFGGTAEENKNYFIIPVNMTDASSLSFKVKVKFFTNKLGLKIYRTMDYVPGMKITDATLFDISGSFSIPILVPVPSVEPPFTDAGTYQIPQNIQGNGFFVFEYIGTSAVGQQAVTTSIQLDDIVIN